MKHCYSNHTLLLRSEKANPSMLISKDTIQRMEKKNNEQARQKHDFWNLSDHITNEIITTNPLKTLIDIKKRVKSIPVYSSEDRFSRREIEKMINQYDNGFICNNDDVIPVLRNIVNEIAHNYKTCGAIDVLSYIFVDVDFALSHINK